MPPPDYLQHEFDPDQLEHFDPALIYEFNFESSMRSEASMSASGIEPLLHAIGQYEDMFSAYLYAETVILPEIKRLGIANITAEHFLEWFKEFHKRVAYTLIADQADRGMSLAGEYSSRITTRWKRSATENPFFSRMLLGFPRRPGKTKFRRLINENKQNLVLEGCSDVEVDAYVEKAWPFLTLLYEMRGSDAIVLSPTELEQVRQDLVTGGREANPENMQALAAFRKLYKAYHADVLSADQKAHVEAIMKVGLPPEEIPGAMRAFAEESVAKWKECAKDDVSAAAQLASAVFYGGSETHGFDNGNGRCSTGMMNTVLCSVGQPSILLRTDGERDDPDSSYSRAIAALQSGTDTTLLTVHIEKRLRETKADRASASADVEHPLAALIKARVQIQRIVLEQLRRGVSRDKVNKAYCLAQALAERDLIRKVGREALEEGCSTGNNALALKLVTKAIAYLQQMSTTPAATAAPAPVQHTRTATETAEILNQLEALTGKEGWKANKSGTLFMMVLDHTQAAEAEGLVRQLREIGALEASSNNGSQKCFVSVRNVNLERLRDVQVAADSADSKAEANDVSSFANV